MIARALLLFAMATRALAAPAFDVASIKPSDPADRRMRFEVSGGKFTARSVSLSWLVQFAYNLQSYQLSGGPGWAITSRFDVTARAGDASANNDRIRQMMQTLLAERFALKIHTENKELPIYRHGERRKGSAPRGRVCRAGLPGVRHGDRRPNDGSRRHDGRLRTRPHGPDRKARAQPDRARRPVRFHLSWTPDDATPGAFAPRGAPPPDQTLASIFTALTEQLGLKLQSDKGPVDVYVIDHAEKLSEN